MGVKWGRDDWRWALPGEEWGKEAWREQGEMDELFSEYGDNIGRNRRPGGPKMGGGCGTCISVGMMALGWAIFMFMGVIR